MPPILVRSLRARPPGVKLRNRSAGVCARKRSRSSSDAAISRRVSGSPRWPSAPSLRTPETPSAPNCRPTWHTPGDSPSVQACDLERHQHPRLNSRTKQTTVARQCPRTRSPQGRQQRRTSSMSRLSWPVNRGRRPGSNRAGALRGTDQHGLAVRAVVVSQMPCCFGPNRARRGEGHGHDASGNVDESTGQRVTH